MTTPGFNRQVTLEHFTEEEKGIIKRFSNEWYITNGGGDLSLGASSNYRYFLMRAADNYREMFNIERDIVVIFSPYTTFESRTLDAIEVAAKKYKTLRIEKICSIVISGDTQVADRLKEMLKNELESQIVVPFAYSEFGKTDDPYFIRNRLKNHFYSRDLFAFEAPLRKDLYFFGRHDLIHDIVNRHKSNENSGLFGLRKTGKTSVIFGVQRVLNKIKAQSTIIDCQNPSFHRRRWNKALHYIISRIKENYKLRINTKSESKYTEENASLNFESDLKKIYNKTDYKNIFIIFDEIENITFTVSPTKHWAEGLDFLFFWQTLRSIFQNNNQIFTYLIAGTNPMCVETPTIQGKDNPIYNQVPYQYMPRFDVPQTREMVRKLGRIMGIKFDEIIYGMLTEDFGGHPFLIRHVCSVINKLSPPERPTRVDKTVYKNSKSIFLKDYGNYIEMILNVLSEHFRDEYQMLKYLARDDFSTFLEFAKASSIYTNHLIGYGIIDENRGRYTFRIESIKEHLLKNEKYKKVSLSQDEKIKEISERRNILEPKLRNLIKTVLFVSYGKDEAKNIFFNILPENRKNKSQNLTLNELFDANKSEIFFDDLSRTIQRKWDLFKNIFGKDKESFTRNMQCINKCRIDAHSKKIDMEMMQYFRICISKIEAQVNSFFE